MRRDLPGACPSMPQVHARPRPRFTAPGRLDRACTVEGFKPVHAPSHARSRIPSMNRSKSPQWPSGARVGESCRPGATPRFTSDHRPAMNRPDGPHGTRVEQITCARLPQPIRGGSGHAQNYPRMTAVMAPVHPGPRTGAWPGSWGSMNGTSSSTIGEHVQGIITRREGICGSMLRCIGPKQLDNAKLIAEITTTSSKPKDTTFTRHPLESASMAIPPFDRWSSLGAATPRSRPLNSNTWCSPLRLRSPEIVRAYFKATLTQLPQLSISRVPLF